MVELEPSYRDSDFKSFIANTMDQSNSDPQRVGSPPTGTSLKQAKVRVRTLMVSRRSLGYPVSLEEMKVYADANNMMSSAVTNVLTHMAFRMKNGPLFFDWFFGEPFVGVAADNCRRNISMATPERVEILKSILGKTDSPRWTVVGV